MVEFVYARHDFVPEHEDEIPFRAGERIDIVEKDEFYEDGWWKGRNLAGKIGLFPESYTQPTPPTSEPHPAPISSSFIGNGEVVYAQHDFVPEHADEIPFRAGERIDIVEKDELYGDGWWKGRNLEGKIGIFPESYTQSTPTSEPHPAPISSSFIGNGEVVYARRDFVPEHEDEIPFRAGERIDIVEKDEFYEDGWWKGRNLAGKVGLFPECYTQATPPASNPPSPTSSSSASNGKSMLAIMTDVEQAIDSHGESSDHETDTDADGEGWYIVRAVARSAPNDKDDKVKVIDVDQKVEGVDELVLRDYIKTETVDDEVHRRSVDSEEEGPPPYSPHPIPPLAPAHGG